MSLTINVGDCRQVLPTLPDQSIQCCVTSPLNTNSVKLFGFQIQRLHFDTKFREPRRRAGVTPSFCDTGRFALFLYFSKSQNILPLRSLNRQKTDDAFDTTSSLFICDAPRKKRSAFFRARLCDVHGASKRFLQKIWNVRRDLSERNPLRIHRLLRVASDSHRIRGPLYPYAAIRINRARQVTKKLAFCHKSHILPK